MDVTAVRAKVKPNGSAETSMVEVQIDVQMLLREAPNPPHIVLVGADGKLKPFHQMQDEYAVQALKIAGPTQNHAADQAQVNRNTLRKWLARARRT